VSVAPALGLWLMLAAGLGLAWLTADAPVAPGRARELARADGLSALVVIVAAGHGLAGLARGERRPWRLAVRAGLLGAAALMGHLAAAGALLLGAAALSTPGGGQRRPVERLLIWLPALCAALGLGLVGLAGGEWRYGAPTAGGGLNSASFGLLLLGALLGAGAAALPRGKPPASDPLMALGCVYGLLRLFSLGPWNLGWLFAALLAGGGAALWAAWAGAAAPPAEGVAWSGLYLGGLAVAGAGLGSGAGLTMAGYALLLGPALRLGLADVAPHRAHWLLSAAVPLGAPFVLAWMAVAAAAAGGVTVLAAALWAAALLAALPPARLALQARQEDGGAGEGSAPERAAEPGSPPQDAPDEGRAGSLAAVSAAVAGGAASLRAAPGGLLAAAALSGALGLGAPLVVAGLLRPMVAQLQGGLTPFGEIELWPWAGLIAFDSARQPVATLPSLALVGLMLILAALCWVVLRLSARRER
jgi:hypothetical protein